MTKKDRESQEVSDRHGETAADVPRVKVLDPSGETAAPAPREKVLDLSGETAADAAKVDTKEIGKEKFRGGLAWALVGATIAVPILSYLGLLVGRDADDVTTLAQVLYPPLVGLVGAVIGFYFGERRD